MQEELIDRAYAARILPPRRADGHKGTFGKVLLLGGSVGFTGAAYLAACAAERSGCGLTFLGVPESIWAIEAVKCAGAMPFPLPEVDGKLCCAAIAALEEKLDTCDVVAAGPGLGRGGETREFICELLASVQQPLVLDADGLNALEGCAEKLDARRGKITVLTPHDGEFARLSGYEIGKITSASRAEIVRSFAVRHGCVLVLKGHRTLIALPDGSLLRNTSGCSALSKGGSGDVLTGLLASLLAQRATAEEAAALAVWLHGRAGEVLEETMTAYCAHPEELVASGLQAAFGELCRR